MKTKTIIAILAVVAIISFGATQVSVEGSSNTAEVHDSQGTLGGLASDEK